MKLEETDRYSRTEYKEKCICGKTHVILTQDDNSPEYHVDVYVKCDCGEYVPFVLPVN